MRQTSDENQPTLLITGNPVDGFFFYGPFAVAPDAIEWAERNHSDQEWWSAPLIDPDRYEQENGDDGI